MTYERVQKSSSWIPKATKKKSHFAPQPFTVQTKRGKTDKSQAPAYAPVADDWVTNNPLMRSIQTAENKEAQALQRQEESEDKDDLQMLSQEGTIQRQCDSCDSQVSSEQEKQPIQAKLNLGQSHDGRQRLELAQELGHGAQEKGIVQRQLTVDQLGNSSEPEIDQAAYPETNQSKELVQTKTSKIPLVQRQTQPLPGLWNPPGRQPIPFYIGNQAHIGIAALKVLNV